MADRSDPPDLDKASGPHLWTTLGYRRVAWARGSTTIAWDATAKYGFPTRGGHVVQGGLVTALLDAAMGGACWSVLDDDQSRCTQVVLPDGEPGGRAEPPGSEPPLDARS